MHLGSIAAKSPGKFHSDCIIKRKFNSPRIRGLVRSSDKTSWLVFKRTPFVLTMLPITFFAHNVISYASNNVSPHPKGCAFNVFMYKMLVIKHSTSINLAWIKLCNQKFLSFEFLLKRCNAFEFLVCRKIVKAPHFKIDKLLCLIVPRF